MTRLISLAIRLVGLVLLGGIGGAIGFGMGGPPGAILLGLIGGFIGFFVAIAVWRGASKSNGGH